MARSCLFLVFGAFAAAAVVLLVLQLIQYFDDRKNGATIQGVVLDQNGKPLSGVAMKFRAWNWRWYVPIPFSPTRIVERKVSTTTTSNGSFFAKATLPRTDFVSAVKTGYCQDGPETEYMWEPLQNGPRKQWTLHLFEKALIRNDQLKSLNFDSLRFAGTGQLAGR
jgi:hypothetical protein